MVVCLLLLHKVAMPRQLHVLACHDHIEACCFFIQPETLIIPIVVPVVSAG